MDIKKLTQEVLLKNMTPEQQLAVLDSVQASVKEAKAVQKQKIAENVDLVLQALKRIEADMLKRVNSSAEIVEARVKTIKDGKDGKNGLDGKAGKDGINGKDGKDGRDGRDGFNGKAGERGQDGVGVQDAHIDFDGCLIIKLTDGQELNVGEVVPFDVAEKIKVIGNGGGTSQYVVDALADLQTQIDNISGGLTYKGTWNASTNSPTLTSSTGTKGWYYVVSTAGSTNLDGVTDWQIGDWAIYNGSTWQKIDQTDVVTSVNGNTGAVVLTASSVGALDTITSTDGSVTVSGTGTTRDLSVATAASTTNVLVAVRNTTGATLTKGTVVYMSGATGQIPTVTKAIATTDGSSAQTLGMITADLANNSNGHVTIIGLISDIDTSAYTDGEQLYLSGSTAGTVTTTKPYAPTHLVYVGIVEYAHAIHGKIFVKVQNGYELDELHNVSAQSPTTGQTIVYNSSTSLWEKNTVSLTAGVNGTLPIANGGTGATTAAAAITALTGTQTSGRYLRSDGTNATLSAIQAADVPTLNQNTTGSAATATTATNVSGGTANVTSITDSGNLTFTGTGNLITGDFSNATTSNRVLFKTSTTNGATRVGAYPDGTSQTAGYYLYNSSDVNNASVGQITQDSAAFYLQATFTGTGTALPMYFATNGTERMRIDTSGNVGIGTNSPVAKLNVKTLDGTTQAMIAGTTIGARYTTDASGIYIDGTDPTGASSYQPLFVGGSVWGVRISGTEKMRLDSSGNLGIGTSSPESLSNFKFLDVGSSSTNQGVVQANNGTVKTAIYSNGTEGYLATRTAHNLNFQTNGSTRATIDTNGQMSTTNGAGSVAKAYDARAWVNFNGTGTVAIRASGNVSSITDNNVGNYTVNFSTAMPDVNYAVVLGGLNSNADTNNILRLVTGYASAVGSCNVYAGDNSSDTLTDVAYVHVAVLR